MYETNNQPIVSYYDVVEDMGKSYKIVKRFLSKDAAYDFAKYNCKRGVVEMQTRVDEPVFIKLYDVCTSLYIIDASMRLGDFLSSIGYQNKSHPYVFWNINGEWMHEESFKQTFLELGFGVGETILLHKVMKADNV